MRLAEKCLTKNVSRCEINLTSRLRVACSQRLRRRARPMTGDEVAEVIAAAAVAAFAHHRVQPAGGQRRELLLAKSLYPNGMTSSPTRPSVTRSWIASFTMRIGSSSRATVCAVAPAKIQNSELPRSRSSRARCATPFASALRSARDPSQRPVRAWPASPEKTAAHSPAVDLGSRVSPAGKPDQCGPAAPASGGFRP